MTTAGWLLCVAGAVLILVFTIGGYKLGRYNGDRKIEEIQAVNGALHNDNQMLTAQNADQKAKLAGLQDKLTSVQAELDAITLPENTYEISPNQSKIVAGGHLTIGLVGSPTNESVNININGKQQSAAAGDVINFGLDPSMTCRVRVRSFGMFKAVVTATCADVKP
jgi:hypothetical protein